MPRKGPEARKAYQAAYYAEHREEQAAYDAAYRDKMKASIAAWAKANPDKRRASDAARRARKAGATGRTTAEQWKAIVAAYNSCCAYCGEKFPARKLWTLARASKVFSG